VTRDDVGRVLAASLHQAIADLLPTRLEFYESWLRPESLHDGRMGLAPFNAVLSFLRKEGDVYGEVMTRAGAYAADWTVSGLSPMRRAWLRRAPAWIRRRLVLGVAREMVGRTFPRSRARTRWRKGAGTLAVRESVFCTVREPVARPLCTFYEAAVQALMEGFAVPVSVEITTCRGTGAGEECLIAVHPEPDR
jgi:hypothetical protein